MTRFHTFRPSGWLADDELEGALDAAGLELTAVRTAFLCV